MDCNDGYYEYVNNGELAQLEQEQEMEQERAGVIYELAEVGDVISWLYKGVFYLAKVRAKGDGAFFVDVVYEKIGYTQDAIRPVDIIDVYKREDF